MKKLLFVFPIVALLAAGCNSSQQAYNQTQNPSVANQPVSQTPTPSTTLSTQNAPASNASTTSVQSSADATRQQGLDLNAKIHLLSPQNGTALCIGQPIDLKWQVPPDMVYLSLELVTADDQPPIYNLGTFPASYKSSKNDGNGNYLWTVGSNIPPNAAYHIVLKGTYKGWALYTYSPGTFSVNDCLNSNAPKY
jgi:hypothetical protein